MTGLPRTKKPAAIPSAMIPGLRNSADRTVTIRVDTSVVHETDSGNAKADETIWMRLTLDTVGRRSWPLDRQGRAIYPEGFEALAAKLQRPLHPPGRDVRCIVSVGMLTEGWDCNTVTHVIGLRPFQSQLLCEQVVGRALRRRSNEIGGNGMFAEEPAYIFGVPFEVVPFKAVSGTPKPRPPQRRIHAVPAKDNFAITVPRVERLQPRNQQQSDGCGLAGRAAHDPRSKGYPARDPNGGGAECGASVDPCTRRRA